MVEENWRYQGVSLDMKVLKVVKTEAREKIFPLSFRVLAKR